MESVSIDSTTRYLDDADILSTKKHFEDLDKLRVHVGKMSALESLHCTDLLKIQDTLKKRERSASKKVATADATTTVGAKKSFHTYFKRPKKYAVLSDKRTVWRTCTVLKRTNNVKYAR